jgi:glycosyltransferase involved in cell wall biosynthesis
LLAAAARLRDEGLAFSVVALAESGGPAHAEAVAAVAALGLEDTVSMIPFVPHWCVPEFLAACDCVCFLENRFAIRVHRPQVPREVATAGRCLVVAAEVAGHDATVEPMRDGENVVLVDDPDDVESLSATLRRVLAQPLLRDRVAQNGRTLYRWPSEDDCLRWTRRLIAICVRSRLDATGRRLSLESLQKHAAEDLRRSASSRGAPPAPRPRRRRCAADRARAPEPRGVARRTGCAGALLPKPHE